MKAQTKDRRRRRPGAGRHWVSVGAIALLGLSGYELWVRLEDFWAWTSGVRHLSQVRKTPFLEDLAIVFETPEMRELGFKLVFLALSILFAVICLARRKHARWGVLIMAGALLGCGAALGLYSLRPSSWLQGLKLAPLALIIAGCVVNIAHRAIRRARRGKRAHEPAEHNAMKGTAYE